MGSILGALVIVAALVLFNRPRGGGGAKTAYQPTAGMSTNATNPADAKVLGQAGAPVRIIEFADFQCPYCKQFHDQTLPQLLKEFVDTGVVRFEYHHFAFLGAESTKAAQATECMADQRLFWEYGDALFQKQGQENSGTYSEPNLKSFAREVAAAHADRPFDAKQFDSCLSSGSKASVVQADTQTGQLAGVKSTPSFLVNGQLVAGAQPIDAFRKIIQAAQQSAGKQ